MFSAGSPKVGCRAADRVVLHMQQARRQPVHPSTLHARRAMCNYHLRHTRGSIARWGIEMPDARVGVFLMPAPFAFTHGALNGKPQRKRTVKRFPDGVQLGNSIAKLRTQRAENYPQLTP